MAIDDNLKSGFVRLATAIRSVRLTTESNATTLASKADLVSGKVPVAQAVASSVMTAATSNGTATRPTTRTDITVIFIGPGSSPATVVAGQTNGMYVGDIHMVTVA